jgi:hypothetical protein
MVTRSLKTNICERTCSPTAEGAALDAVGSPLAVGRRKLLVRLRRPDEFGDDGIRRPVASQGRKRCAAGGAEVPGAIDDERREGVAVGTRACTGQCTNSILWRLTDPERGEHTEPRAGIRSENVPTPERPPLRRDLR